jgi:hypothetical protein
MTDDRKSALALIAGSAGTLVTMAFHPTGHELLAPGQLDHMTFVVVATHALALVSIPILFLGALGIARRLASPDRMPIAALVFYGFGLVGAMMAAVASGLVAPQLARKLAQAEPAARDMWDMAMHFNGMVNQSFAILFVVASSLAILLWSISIVRSAALARSIGYYGGLLGLATIALILSGTLRLNVHGMGMVVLGQSIWYVIIALTMWEGAGSKPSRDTSA